MNTQAWFANFIYVLGAISFSFIVLGGGALVVQAAVDIFTDGYKSRPTWFKLTVILWFCFMAYVLGAVATH